MCRREMVELQIYHSRNGPSLIQRRPLLRVRELGKRIMESVIPVSQKTEDSLSETATDLV